MAELKTGDPAPAFSALNANGEKVRLKDFVGQTVVLYFYPKDDTPGCTTEACSFRDSHGALKKKAAVVLGISPDPAVSHRKFINKYSLPFSLLADEDKKIASAYGVWVEKSLYGKKYRGTERSTFVINGKGRITHIFRKVNPKTHLDEVLAALP